MDTDLCFQVTAHELPGCTILTVLSGEKTISLIPFWYETEVQPSASDFEIETKIRTSLSEAVRSAGFIPSYVRQTRQGFEMKKEIADHICIAIMTLDVFGLSMLAQWYVSLSIFLCAPVWWWLRRRKLNLREKYALKDAVVFDQIESQLHHYQKSDDFEKALKYALSLQNTALP